MTTITKEERSHWREVAANATIGPPTGNVDFHSPGLVKFEFEAKSTHAGDYLFLKTFTPSGIISLLDDLDTTKARAEKAEASCLVYVRMLANLKAQLDSADGDILTLTDLCDAYLDGNIEMAQRLEKAEAVIKGLRAYNECPPDSSTCVYMEEGNAGSDKDCNRCWEENMQKWLEYHEQQAAKGGE